MTTLLYVFLAILLFGFLIVIHELGHYLFARLFKVTINEFSIGMGNSIFSHVSKKTGIIYSLRLFPIGGYVSMVGENGDSDDPNAFSKKPAWQRLIIIAAGATVNLAFGLLLMLLLVCMTASGGIYTNKVGGYVDDPNYQITSNAYIQPNDIITKIGNQRTYNAYDVSYEIMRKGNQPINVTVKRNGQIVVLEDVVFPVTVSNGVEFGYIDFRIIAEEANVGNVLLHTAQRSMLTVRMVWESLYDLITGRYGVEAVSGPVGITETIVGATDEAVKTKDYSSVVYLAAVICINLGVMNLLPVPALDGGRLVFIFIELLFRKPVPQNIEGYIHGIGMYLLLALMVLISLKDVWGLIFR